MKYKNELQRFCAPESQVKFPRSRIAVPPTPTPVKQSIRLTIKHYNGTCYGSVGLTVKEVLAKIEQALKHEPGCTICVWVVDKE
jgi:hypothetical protein